MILNILIQRPTLSIHLRIRIIHLTALDLVLTHLRLVDGGGDRTNLIMETIARVRVGEVSEVEEVLEPMKKGMVRGCLWPRCRHCRGIILTEGVIWMIRR